MMNIYCSMRSIGLAASVGCTVLGGPAMAQPVSLMPFDQFLQQVSSASTGSSDKPQSSSAGTVPTQQMQQHILNMYNGVHVHHSYLVDSYPYDCIPINEQPSVKLRNLQAIASPPPYNVFPQGGDGLSPAIAQVDPAAKTDQLGNAQTCESGSIPMRRVTLDAISHFKTLHDFFQKGPNGAGHADPATPPAAASVHKYAHSYQFVSNVGGRSDISLWSPSVDTSANEIFSLTQFWFSNNAGPVQTVESGIQNYPQKYNTTSSVLFIYWTADNYNQTGCYNLDCAAFVQTNPNVHLGSKFRIYSSDGGGQYFINLRALLFKGNWWIYLGGGNPSNAIGYYPGSLYKGTAMAKGANEIDFGGEVVGSTVWPPMGSGNFASAGFGHSAFQKNINYFSDPNTSVAANLTASQTSISCYTDVTHNSSGKPGWNTFFFYGGPGGSGC